MNGVDSPQEPEMISTKEAAKLLSLKNHHTLEIWRIRNRQAKEKGKPAPHPELVHAKIGGIIRYFRTSLIEFIKDNTSAG